MDFKHYGYLVNGAWIGAASGKTFQVTNPMNSQVFLFREGGDIGLFITLVPKVL